MSGPRVSVVIPTRGTDAPAARGRLADQDCPDVEIVVGGGGRSPAAGRNLGAQRARGEILVFLDDDVALAPASALGALAEGVRTLPDAGAVGAAVALPPDATPFQQRLARQVPRIVLPPPQTPTAGLPTGACLAVTREAYFAVGGFDESLPSGEDVAFCLALERRGRRNWVIPGATVLHPPPPSAAAVWRKFVWYGRGQHALAARHGFGGHRRWVRWALPACAYAAVRFALAPLHAVLDWRDGRPHVGFHPLRAWASAAAAFGFAREAVTGPRSLIGRVRARLGPVPPARWPALVLGALARRLRPDPALAIPWDEPAATAAALCGRPATVAEAVAAWRARAAALPLAPDERAGAVRALAAAHPVAVASLRAAAEAAARHEFDLLGSGPRRVVRAEPGEPVDWHVDPVSGYRWPAGVPAAAIPIEPGRGFDIKAPWERARGMHLVTLAQAACVARFGTPADEAAWQRLGGEAIAQMADFAAQNPPGMSVNWACAMDVGLRAANWCAALGLLADHPALHDATLLRLLGALYAHGRFVRAHLERGADGVNSNHYLGDLTGLTYLGAALPGREAAAWLAFARDEWAREIAAQFHPDGGNHEGSVPYHRLSLEMAAACAQVLALAGTPLPAPALDRVRAAFRFAREVLTPAGALPQIGDNDSGRLHVWHPGRAPLDGRYLADWGAVATNEAALRLAGGPLAPEAAWLFGAAAAAHGGDGGKAAASVAFPNVGLWILRAHGFTVYCRAAPPRRGTGSHVHNDQLAVEVHDGDVPLVVDPGTGTYTPAPAVRDAFRSVRAHATVEVDGQEPVPLPRDLFRLPDAAPARLLTWAPDADPPSWSAEHLGYRRLDAPLLHRRTVRVLADGVEILDEIVPVGADTGRRVAEARLPLAPGTAATVEAGAVRLVAAGRAWRVESGTAPLVVESAEYSADYGRREPTLRLAYRLEGPTPLRLHARIRRA